MTDIELIKKYIEKDKQELAIKRLNDGYPVQYILGNVEFYNCNILVNENVLIPRFETEYLVDKTIKYLNFLDIKNPQVLEIGTGSGCIAIALKKNVDCNITALDISKEALEVANKNALLNSVNINFIERDIHEYNSLQKYDLIISNPPYVPYNSLVDEKIKFEPSNAIYAPIISDYCSFCDSKSIFLPLIAFEIGDKEGDMVKELANRYLNNPFIKIEKDYNNYERYVFISNKVIL